MKLLVADLIVEITPKYEMLKSRIKPYIYDGEREPDIVISISEKVLKDQQKRYCSLSLESCEYLFTGTYFYTELIKFGGVLLHSSCVQYENFAYLFSANSGVGKSTHTHLWLEKFPTAEILNDDKPAIRKIGDKYYAYGTPWSGKFNENINTKTEIAGITFLSRGETNEITRVTGEDALIDFMNQTVRPRKKEYMIFFMEILDGILKEVPVFKMKCNISLEAVETSYNAMKRS